MAQAGPNPRRHTDGIRGLLPKVFIVYPHNPQPYQWSPPTPAEDFRRLYPGASDGEIRQRQMEEMETREAAVNEVIRQHDQLVYLFAQFLESHKIAVAYEGLLLDCPTPNYMRWFQEQMKDSDFILLIITESFEHFLSHTPPDGKERIFTGEFMHNVIHNPDPSRPLLPIFLNRPENRDLLPDALRASSTYHITANSHPPYFNVHQPQLDSLYAILTRQNRTEPPPPVSSIPIIGPRQRRRCKPLIYALISYLFILFIYFSWCCQWTCPAPPPTPAPPPDEG